MASDTGIGRAEALGFDPDGGQWVSVCWRHGEVMNHEIRSVARDCIYRGADGQMRMEGCSECQAEIGGTR